MASDIAAMIRSSLVDIVLIKASGAGQSCPKLIHEFSNILKPGDVAMQEDLMSTSTSSNAYCGVTYDGLELKNWRVTTPTPGQKNT